MAENDEQDFETYEEEAPRSIFSALWFRALVVVLVLGVVAAVAVPYVLDVMTTPTARSTVAFRPTASPPPAAAPPKPAPAAAAPAPTPAVEPPKPEAAKPEPPKPEAAKPEPAKPEMPKPEPARPMPAKPEGPRAIASKPAGPGKPADAPAAMEPAKPAPSAKPAEATAPSSEPKPAEPPRVAVAPPAPRESPSLRAAVRSAAGAPYWVQVGAFKNEASARRLADKLRNQNFTVEQSMRTRRVSSARAGGAALAADRYNVFVSGLAPNELSAKLGAKGLAAKPVAGGVMVTPSMPLREAVTLSKDLAGEGLKVQVRRVVTAGAGSGPSPSASPAGTDEVLHRVRVGAFADRAAAVAAAKDLEAKGFKVYISRGNQ